ncbi:MAG: ribonuclease P protein component [Kiritimatiellaceae bacterium]|nr:ribonuclease P protein component [Kiritimatiellaceae bacterium]
MNNPLSPELKPVAVNTLSKEQRLVQASLFREAFAQKNSRIGHYMVIWLRTGENASLRLGVVTSKKVSNRAVDRNLARRRVREIFRQHRAELSGAVDFVIVARRNLLTAAHADVEAEFLRLTRKAGAAR